MLIVFAKEINVLYTKLTTKLLLLPISGIVRMFINNKKRCETEIYLFSVVPLPCVFPFFLNLLKIILKNLMESTI